MKKYAAILLFLTPAFCLAQKTVCKNLVFEGAGIRGLAYAGVLEEFDRAGWITPVRKVGGTSAGSVIAMTIALGYSPLEVEQIVRTTDFSNLNDGRYIFFGGIHRVTKHYGWYRGGRIDAWLGDLIAAKTGDRETTFRQLHERGFKDLYVTATCLNRQKLLVFSHDTYPDMKIKDAVRISMSIPLYFEAVFIDGKGAIIHNSKKRKDLDLVVDGGILGNFPITMFDSTRYGPAQEATRVPNMETIGVRIDSDDQIESDKVNRELTGKEITNFGSYLNAFYVLIHENLNRGQLTAADWQRTISVSSKHIGPKVRKLSAAEETLLIEAGRESVVRYLSN